MCLPSLTTPQTELGKRGCWVLLRIVCPTAICPAVDSLFDSQYIAVAMHSRDSESTKDLTAWIEVKLMRSRMPADVISLVNISHFYSGLLFAFCASKNVW